MRHLWVLLLGISFVFWNKDALVEIGNHIGRFLHFEESMLFAVDKHVGRILVEIDMLKGLHEKLGIDWRGRSFS